MTTNEKKTTCERCDDTGLAAVDGTRGELEPCICTAPVVTSAFERALFPARMIDREMAWSPYPPPRESSSAVSR